MKTNNYHVWEGEVEAATLEANGISFLSAVFTGMLGILLFFVLIAKTLVMGIFGIKPTSKASVVAVRAESTSEYEVSVS